MSGEQRICGHFWRTSIANGGLHSCKLPAGHQGEHACASCPATKQPDDSASERARAEERLDILEIIDDCRRGLMGAPLGDPQAEAEIDSVVKVLEGLRAEIAARGAAPSCGAARSLDRPSATCNLSNGHRGPHAWKGPVLP